MVPRTTRLEYSIIAVALLVLLFSSKPPRPGTAGVNQTEELYPETTGLNNEILTLSSEEVPSESDLAPTTSGFDSTIETPNEPEEEEIIPTESLHEATTPAPLPIPKITSAAKPERIASPNRTTKRQVTLNTGDYTKQNENTQGNISVRWVWNGQEFVPQKVRVVKEPNGVTKVWSIDDEDKTK